jgi:excisionase family DNA binding protein
MTTPLMVTTAEAAVILAVSEDRVRSLAKTGVLERRFIGKGTRNYRILYSSLQRYVDGLSQDPVSA